MTRTSKQQELFDRYRMREFLAWVDIETTGLDPEFHTILEIGIVLSTREGEIVYEDSGLVPSIPFDDLFWSPGTLQFHEDTGLVDELRTAKSSYLRLETVRQRFQSVISSSQIGGPRNVELAGSSPMFDLLFLLERSRRWGQCFFREGRRCMDVSVLRQTALEWGLVPWLEEPEHRALPDAKAELAEFLHYKAQIEERKK